MQTRQEINDDFERAKELRYKAIQEIQEKCKHEHTMWYTWDVTDNGTHIQQLQCSDCGREQLRMRSTYHNGVTKDW